MLILGRVFSLNFLILWSGLLLFSANASAADWTTTKGITASLVYTDNVNLVDSGKKSDLSPLVTPNVSIHGKGARANVDLTAALEVNGQSGNNDTINPRLQVNANAELLKRLAFIDFNATATQNVIDPLSVAGSDNLSNRGNKTTTYSYKISPYLKGRFKGFANAELRYTYDQLNHSEGSVSDTNSESVDLTIDSGPEFVRATWGIDASNKTTDNDQGQVSQLSSLDLRLGYKIDRRWQVTGKLGNESNDYNSIQPKKDGSSWELGTIWTPSQRTTLDVGFGKRFFGNTKHLNFTHKSRRSVLSARYSEELTDSTTLLSNQTVFQYVDAFGQPILDPVTGDPLLLVANLPTINTSTFVDKRLAIDYTLKGRRTTLKITGDMSDQIYQDSTRKTSTKGVGASLSRTLSAKINGDVSLNWDGSKEQGTGSRETDTWRFQAGLNQRLGTKTNLRFNYSYIDRSANQAGQSYDENKLTLTLMHTL